MTNVEERYTNRQKFLKIEFFLSNNLLRTLVGRRYCLSTSRTETTRAASSKLRERIRTFQQEQNDVMFYLDNQP